jgi:hypothetical protein
MGDGDRRRVDRRLTWRWGGAVEVIRVGVRELRRVACAVP